MSEVQISSVVWVERVRVALIKRLYGLPNLGVSDVSLRWGSIPLGSFEVKCFAFFWGWGRGTTLVFWSFNQHPWCI